MIATGVKNRTGLKSAIMLMALVTAAVFFSPLGWSFWPLALPSFVIGFLLFLTTKKDGDGDKAFLFAVLSLVFACVLWFLKFLYLLIFFANGL